MLIEDQAAITGFDGCRAQAQLSASLRTPAAHTWRKMESGDPGSHADRAHCGSGESHHECSNSEIFFALIMDLTFDMNEALGSLVHASATVSPTG